MHDNATGNDASENMKRGPGHAEYVQLEGQKRQA